MNKKIANFITNLTIQHKSFFASQETDRPTSANTLRRLRKILIGVVTLAFLFIGNSIIFQAGSAFGAESYQEECPANTFDWSGYEEFNVEKGEFPFVVTIVDAGGTGLDITMKIPRAGQDNNHVNTPGSTNFPGVLDLYTSNPEVFRFWRQNDAEIDTITIDFSESIVAFEFMFGGQRPPQLGDYAYLEVTFWDGPDGTGNKVVSQLEGGPGVVTEIATGDPVVSAINVLSEQGEQRSFLSDDTYVGIGMAKQDRPWTVLQMNGVSFRSITWSFYASSVDTDDLDEARANIIDAGNMSAYISGFDYSPSSECNESTGSLGDTIWLDANADGIQDAEEEGIPGVQLELCAIDGTVVATTTTSITGTYLFDDLPLDEYTVKVVTSTLPYSLSQTFDASGDLDHQSTTTLTAEVPDNIEQDFGYVRFGSIGDIVWLDSNSDGIQDPEESGIPDVLLELCDIDTTVIATTTTDSDGYYLFEQLVLGEYQVKVVTSTLPSGIRQTYDASDSLDDRSATTIDVETAHNREQDFGYSLLASVGDTVWIDTDADGIQGATEEGLKDVVVQLLTLSKSVVATTTTDMDGRYEFTDLVPSDYCVQVVVPNTYIISPQDSGVDDTVDSDIDPETGLACAITLLAGEHDPTWDAGVTPEACVGSQVWFDDNKDGIKDSDEDGINGVDVTLYGMAGNIVATASTDSQGFFEFCSLLPGDYALGFVAPNGMIFTNQSVIRTNGFNSDADPESGRTEAISLDSGEYDPSWGAGFIPATPASLNTVDEPVIQPEPIITYIPAVGW
ncbi:MAG: SdrD B-like domain-containing protein [Chloroflexota bacterium]